MVIALLGVWTSVAVVYFDLVDYKGVMDKAKDIQINLSESLQGKLSAYDADGDGDFDVEDAKVLLRLKESAVAPATKMEAAAPVEQPALDAPAPSDQAVIEPDPVEVEEEIQAEAAEEMLAPPPVPEQEAEEEPQQRAGHAVRSCPDKVTAPLPGPAEPAGQRALPEEASDNGMLVVVGGLETEQQAEVAETDNSSAPIHFEIVNISNSVDPKSDEQIQSQSIAETSLVDMTGDSLNEDQIMVQEDGSKACSILSPIVETVKSEMVGQEVGVGTTPTDTKPHLVD
ncbi:unnamed protein product [Boreogadus saida]